MAREPIPITPRVLTWARERAQFSIEEARETFRNIEAWEAGEAYPTYPQLERLSETFKVPVAVFFFPEPPELPPLRESFRTLPEAQFEHLPRALRYLLRRAKALQINLAELNDGRNPAEHFIVRDLQFHPDMEVAEMARMVREYLEIDVEMQLAWPDDEIALENWRDSLERVGIAVFKDAFKADLYSGFCLYDTVFPLIYVNNSVAKTRQIFTLFHELAHILFRTSGIDTDLEIEGLLPRSRQIEILCNRFAAEFLLPEERFEAEFRGLPATERTAEELASRFHVSREFIFRKFLDRDLITADIYQEAAHRWADQRQGGGGGNHYWTKIAYLGTNYINLALSRYHQNRISEDELADYLDVKVKNLQTLEDYFTKKVT